VGGSPLFGLLPTLLPEETLLRLYFIEVERLVLLGFDHAVIDDAPYRIVIHSHRHSIGVTTYASEDTYSRQDCEDPTRSPEDDPDVPHSLPVRFSRPGHARERRRPHKVNRSQTGSGNLPEASERPISHNQESGAAAGSGLAAREGRELSEAQLIRKACQGDDRSVRILYERYAPRVHAVVRRIAGDDELAQDYAQEAWIRAIRALPTFRGDSRFSTWLHRIAVNAALQAARKAETQRKRQAPMPEEVPVPPPGGDVLLQQQLEWALDRLPEGMRQVMILHDVEGYTHEEIGEVLGVTSGTSKSQLFKARARMRGLLGALDRDSGTHEEAEAWSI